MIKEVRALKEKEDKVTKELKTETKSKDLMASEIKRLDKHNSQLR